MAKYPDHEAKQLAALKRARRLVFGITVVVVLTTIYMAYKTFF
jgi:hypothetical protein